MKKSNIVLLIVLALVAVLVIWAGVSLKNAFKTSTTDIYTASCGNFSLLMRVTTIPYAASGGDINSFVFNYEGPKGEQALYKNTPVSMALDLYPDRTGPIKGKSVYIGFSRPNNENWELWGTSTPMINAFVDSAIFSQDDFSHIASCISKNIAGIDTALDNLASALPERDRRDYRPVQLGSITYDTVSDADNSYFNASYDVNFPPQSQLPLPATFSLGRLLTLTSGQTARENGGELAVTLDEIVPPYSMMFKSEIAGITLQSGNISDSVKFIPGEWTAVSRQFGLTVTIDSVSMSSISLTVAKGPIISSLENPIVAKGQQQIIKGMNFSPTENVVYLGNTVVGTFPSTNNGTEISFIMNYDFPTGIDVHVKSDNNVSNPFIWENYEMAQ